MMKKLSAIFEKHPELISYIIVGFFTTLVDSAVYFPLYNFTSVPAPVCAGLAWASAVIFAFLINKSFVFKSKDWSAKKVWWEFRRFSITRLGTGVLEVLFSLVTVTWLGFDGNLMRVMAWISVAVLNYLSTKYMVFRYKAK